MQAKAAATRVKAFLMFAYNLEEIKDSLVYLLINFWLDQPTNMSVLHPVRCTFTH